MLNDPIFSTPLDRFQTTVLAPHTAGSSSLIVASVTGLGSPTPSNPVRLTCVRASDADVVHFMVTGIGGAGNTLTVAVEDGYTDIDLATDDRVAVLVSAGTIIELQDAANDLVTAFNDIELTPGPQGNQGTQGAAGTDGVQGSQGTAGAQGNQGVAGVGVQGSQGTAGATGPQGRQGSTGAQGSAGSQGFQGSQGATGTQGFQGIVGSTGSQGRQGSAGAQGVAGVQGNQGSQGAAGVAGDQGFQGADGSDGPQGTQGRQGLQGAAGAQGNQGVVGSTGDAGAQGQQGSTGSQGASGVQGLQGSQGSTGTQGNQGVVGAQGSAGVQGSQGFQGVAGVQGSTGAQGSQGVAGADGVQGSTGTQGSQGNQGVVGSTGTQGNQGVVGVQGSQGVQGSVGAQGSQGVAGADGVQGFQGSTGAQGSQGRQGLTGSQGNQGSTGTGGVQGNQGFQGVTGSTGAQGTQGLQGSTGAQGTQGVVGAQGVQGTTGFQGSTGGQGNQGYQGSVGPQGSTGAGVQGATGSQGPQGAVGPQGVQGPQAVGTVTGMSVLALNGFQGSVLTATTTPQIALATNVSGTATMLKSASGVLTGATPGTDYPPVNNPTFTGTVTTPNLVVSNGGIAQVARLGSGATAASSWALSVQNASATDALQLGCSSSAYTTGGVLTWVGNSQPFIYYPSSLRIGTGSGSTATLILDSSLNATFGGTITTPTIVLGGYNAMIKAVAGNLTGATAGTDYVAPTGSGSGLTSLTASNLASGTVPTARLASGTANSGTALRGDQTWGSTPETMYVETGGASCSNTTTATVLTNSGVGTLTLPSNFFSVGRAIRVTAGGIYQTGSSAVNISMFLRFGGNTIGQIGAESTPATNTNIWNWSFSYILWCSSTGSSGTAFGLGQGVRFTAGNVGINSQMVMPGGVANLTLNTTSSQSLNLAWQWGTASTSNSVTLTQFILEALN